MKLTVARSALNAMGEIRGGKRGHRLAYREGVVGSGEEGLGGGGRTAVEMRMQSRSPWSETDRLFTPRRVNIKRC